MSIAAIPIEERHHLVVYDSFTSIWREIDDGLFNSLQNNQNLLTVINDKQKGVTPLFLAIKRKQVETVLLLLANGADPNIECKGATPLWLACYHGLMEIIVALVDNGAHMDVLCNDASPLHVAAARGLVEVCEILCARNANVNITSNKLGTPLHVAISKGHQFVLSCFLQHNPDLTLVNRYGETVLHLACRMEDDKMAMLLLKSKLRLDPFIRDKVYGSTPAHLTTSTKVYKALISKWPELLNATDDQGRSSAFFMPGKRLDFFTSITAKMNENLLQGLWNNREQYADLKIIAPRQTSDQHAIIAAQNTETESLLCNKAMLYARCEWFRMNLKTTEFIPGRYNERPTVEEMFVNEFSSTTMHALIYYLYTDTLKCPHSHLDELRRASIYFKLPRLASIVKGKLGLAVEIEESAFASDMECLLRGSIFADVQLHIEGSQDKLYAHRFILVTHCDYFRTMLSSGMREGQTGIIELGGFPKAIILAFINWLYTFTIDPTLKLEYKLLQLLELSGVFMTSEISMPIQTKILTLMHSNDFRNIGAVVVKAEELKALALLEECALQFERSVSIRRDLKRELDPTLYELLESMTAPRDLPPKIVHHA